MYSYVPEIVGRFFVSFTEWSHLNGHVVLHLFLIIHYYTGVTSRILQSYVDDP